jgi:hypothetical protein
LKKKEIGCKMKAEFAEKSGKTTKKGRNETAVRINKCP